MKISTTLLLFLALIFGGCCTCKEAEVAKPFSIGLSSGGGVSGMYTGFILASNGDVVYWRGFRGQEDSRTVLGTIALEHLTRLKTLVSESHLSTLAFRETGNMTTLLRVSDGSELFTLSWSGIDSDESAVPKEILPVYRELDRILAPYRQKLFEQK